MPIRKVWLGIILIACGGFLSAQPKMLDVPVTVMKETELKIERGNCLVYWKPLYCIYPGSGYRLEAVNGTRRGKNPVKQFTVNLDGNNALDWFASRDNSPRSESSVCMMGRSVLRVTLRGEPGDGIVLGIHAEPGKVDLAKFSGGAHFYTQVEQQNARMRATIPQYGAPPDPAPSISLRADRTAIAIGQAVRLSWDAQNAKSTLFSSPDLGVVEASGSALVWPEKDTLFKIEAVSRSGTAKAEVLVKVAVPEPELEVSLDPKTVYEGEEATLAWRTKNARLVSFADSKSSSLPLSGKMNVKPRRHVPFELQAENGEKKVRRSVEASVLNREEEQRRAEEEKARRTIPPDVDKTLHGLWNELKTALQAGGRGKGGRILQHGDARQISGDIHGFKRQAARGWVGDAQDRVPVIRRKRGHLPH